ncbi:uncharacterized protein LOC143906541 [Temnothorax americanus]|uniref:uncharacterized protein LOC143906541 n=1 Tax=Temnothorax americanus TaxID=1964332 RepID=UPI0040685420
MALRQQLTELCAAGGFPLRKWSANDEAILTGVPAEHRMQRELRAWRPQESHGILGLQWHPGIDSFSFTTRTSPVTSVTKRSVLSLTARLFDPLGWLAPVVVRAKIAFQTTWLQGLDWDDPGRRRPTMEGVSDRASGTGADSSSAEDFFGRAGDWHGFADASERAYAAVIYLRAETEEGSWRVTLMAAKTKVAPLKQVTLARLEFNAAALLVKLASHFKTVLELQGATFHFWSDSMVTLGWIRGHLTRWKTYVANRVSEIQTMMPEALWHYVPGGDNPADCASRGLSPGELIGHQLWWQGPAWLKEDPSTWPASAAALEKGTGLPTSACESTWRCQGLPRSR